MFIRPIDAIFQMGVKHHSKAPFTKLGALYEYK
jgi:hypothetical protein